MPSSQNFRFMGACQHAVFVNIQLQLYSTATVSFCCGWKSYGKGNVSSSGGSCHCTFRDKFRAQHLSTLTALLTWRPPAVVPPCQHLCCEVLSVGVTMYCCHHYVNVLGNRGSCSPSSILWCCGFGWWKHLQQTGWWAVLCHTASAAFPWVARVQQYWCSNLAIEECSAPNKLSVAGPFAFCAKPSVQEVSQEESF